MTKKLQKAILKHLESEVSSLRIAAFKAEQISKKDEFKEWWVKEAILINRKLKQSEKNLTEFKRLYPSK